MSLESDFLEAFEEHSPDGIRRSLAVGASATNPIKGKVPIDCLIEGYLRSPRFADCLQVLYEAGAKLEIELKGIVWGRGQSWETLVLDVTPLSYAQCGLYTQFHRPERDIYSNLQYLYRSRYGTDLQLRNVPNKYLAPKA